MNLPVLISLDGLRKNSGSSAVRYLPATGPARAFALRPTALFIQLPVVFVKGAKMRSEDTEGVHVRAYARRGRTHVSGQGWGELRQTDHICSQELGWVPLWSGLGLPAGWPGFSKPLQTTEWSLFEKRVGEGKAVGTFSALEIRKPLLAIPSGWFCLHILSSMAPVHLGVFLL